MVGQEIASSFQNGIHLVVVEGVGVIGMDGGRWEEETPGHTEV